MKKYVGLWGIVPKQPRMAWTKLVKDTSFKTPHSGDADK